MAAEAEMSTKMYVFPFHFIKLLLGLSCPSRHFPERFVSRYGHVISFHQ